MFKSEEYDKVFRVVDLYHTGVWDKERAIREIKVYPGYDQIAFISQASMDALLKYQSVKEVLSNILSPKARL